MKLEDKFRECPFLPLVTIKKEDEIDTLIEIINTTQIKIIEIAYRSKFASEAIERISRETKTCLGAGTVRTVEQAREAVEKGANFIVTPAMISSVLTYASNYEIPILPGALTPTEVQVAVDNGIKLVKIFPADIIGGIKGINALSGPYPDIKMVPTGGVNIDNYLEYLKHNSILAVGGSFIISNDDLRFENINSTIAKIERLYESIEK